MSDDKEITPESLEDQLKSMLKQANLSFVMPGQPPSPAPVTPDVEEETEVGDPLQPIREFDYRPREIRDYLDRFVIRQDEAKKVLSVAICDHYNHVRACVDMPEIHEQEYAKHNVVLL